MPHSDSLIESIIKDVVKTYSSRDFEIIKQKQLLFQTKRIQPDIQVVQGSNIVCVVEIGYTRPEKIEYYQQLKIPDIRWYSKDGKLLNKKIETKIVDVKYIPANDEMFRLLFLEDGFSCQNEKCILERGVELLVEVEYEEHEKKGTTDQYLEQADEDLEDLPDEELEKMIIEKVGEDWRLQLDDLCYGELWRSSNGRSGFAVWECDICGDTFIETRGVGFYLPINEVEDYSEFLKSHYKQQDKLKERLSYLKSKEDIKIVLDSLKDMVMSFDSLKERIKKIWGFDINYGDTMRFGED